MNGYLGLQTVLFTFGEMQVSMLAFSGLPLNEASVIHQHYHSTLVAIHRLLLAGHPSRILQGCVEQVIVHEEGIFRVVKNQVSQCRVNQERLGKPIPVLAFIDFAVLHLLVAPEEEEILL